MTYRIISSVLAEGSIKGTKVVLAMGKRCYLSGTQGLVVPAKTRLEFPRKSPAHFSRKGMREEIFDAAGTGLKEELKDIQKIIISDSLAPGAFPYAKRVKMRSETILEAGSVVVTPSFSINSKSDGRTPYLLHTVMITGFKSWNTNITALRRSIENCIGVSVGMSLKSLTIACELPKRMELHMRDKVSFTASAIRDKLNFMQESLNTLETVVIFAPEIHGQNMRGQMVAVFQQFFRPWKPAKKNS